MAKEKSSAVLLQHKNATWYEKGEAGSAITPGMLISGVSTIVPHASAAGRAAPRFALEREEMGLGIDDAYATGDTVKEASLAPGDVVNAIIPSGENISEGDWLESNGDGKLQEGNTNPVGFSLDTLGAVTADTRVRCQII